MSALSVADVKYELDNLRPNISLEETEHSWDKISKALQSLIKLCENGAYDVSPSELVNTIRTSHRPIISAMNSERTRLCMVPMDLLSTLATAMGGQFEQLLPLFMPALLTQCARTNKVVVNRAKSSILTIIEVTQLASVLSYFLQNIKDKSATLKVVIAEVALACLNSCNPPDFEKEARAIEIEAIIRATARDANADVRKLSRKIFESYKILLPSRVQSFTTPLSPTTKKYLDIKTAPISTQKSSSNLRANTNVKPEVKSYNPPSSSVTTTTRPTHSRTASSSTVSTGAIGSHTRNQPAALTRVTRKDPTPAAAPAPYVPVRPVQPSRVMTDTQRTNAQRSTNTVGGGTRPTATATQDEKRPIPPLRSQPSIVSRATTGTSATGASSSGAPHRMQLSSRANAAPGGSQALPSTGPRRIPMPPPPPPAPKKDTEVPTRPASRVDNSASSTRQPVLPSAPMKKKPISTLSSSLKDRVQAAPPVSHTRTKSSALTTSKTTTTTRAVAGPAAPSGSGASAGPSSSSAKPLVVAKAKPQWGGRSVPPPKPVPAVPASQKAPATKMMVRKPSSRAISAPKGAAAAAGASKKRPITPAMVALPPSPTPAEEEEESATNVVTKIQDLKDLKDQENVEEPANAAAQPNSPVFSAPSLPDEEVAEAEEKDNQITEENEQVETVGSSSAPTEILTRNPTPVEEETPPTPELEVEAEVDDDDETVGASDLPLTDDDPQTPQQHGLLRPSASTAVLSSKTPISALLSSIERGFKYDYSPITPLSPADNYLPNVTGEGTPYSHATHAPHLKGPMQPFNHALHVAGHNGMFDGYAVEKMRKPKEEELVRRDLGVGVVQLSEYNKIYMPAGLPGLDDGRLAFIELNRG